MKLDNETLQYFSKILGKLDITFLECEIDTTEDGFIAIWGIQKFNPFTSSIEDASYRVSLRVDKVNDDSE